MLSFLAILGSCLASYFGINPLIVLPLGTAALHATALNGEWYAPGIHTVATIAGACAWGTLCHHMFL